MAKNNDLKRLSKFLAVILRHNPGEFGITLDKHGWADLDLVWQAVHRKYGNRYTLDDLHQVVDGDKRGKKRYKIDDDHTHIRAMYGHSHIREIEYPPTTPPDELYHGTNTRAAKAIQQEGLQSKGRQYVHLTTNKDNATVVASRRTSKPVLLIVRAKEAHENGLVFHQAEDEHYLTKHVPPEYIDFPDV
jgi:putative RNA 2'-phosphotransferase